MEEFPSNSHRPKKEIEPKKVEKVIEGQATLRRKPLGKKFLGTFIQGNPREAWSGTIWDVMMPALKDMVFDMLSQGASGTLFGEAAHAVHRRNSRTAQSGNTAYHRMAQPGRTVVPEPRQQGISARARATHDFDEILFEQRHQALEVIDRMYDLLNKYEAVSVKDLYDCAGLEPEFTDVKWGWTDLRGTEPVRVRGGYILSLPRPVVID